MENVISYFKKIYNTRFFLIHLVRWDIKFKFRRSKLGLLWTVLQPMLLTAIIAVVFGFVFKQPIGTYAPYILSGILVWDVISAAVIGNGSSFIQAESYIRQVSHPVMIYPIRASLVSIINFMLATIGLFIWILFVYPQNLLTALISLPLTAIIYFIIAWSISVISSHMYVRYRDVMALVMQLLWYLSPVFFKEEMFLSNPMLHGLFILNPITHILMLIRQPFLYGCFADTVSYIYSLCIAAIMLLLAWEVNKRCEKTVIYYL